VRSSTATGVIQWHDDSASLHREHALVRPPNITHISDGDPPYLGLPILEDLRLLLPFVFGMACVHMTQGKSPAEDDIDEMLEKLEIYPYGM